MACQEISSGGMIPDSRHYSDKDEAPERGLQLISVEGRGGAP